MILTRYATRLAKPLWSSATSQYPIVDQLVKFPCRAITTGRDHLRQGNDDPKVLDAFIGKWTELKSPAQHRIKDIEGRPREMTATNTWISFSKSGNTWTCKKGFVDKPDCFEIKFQLNKQKFESIDGITKKIIFVQQGSKMIEKQEKFGDASTATTITRFVAGDIMTANFADKDGEIIKKSYSKGK